MALDKQMAQLTRLELTNFRAFANVHLDFAPITLLAGANSSGKSSVLSAVASILQTRSPNLFPFDLTPNGTNCSLGGFKDIVHGGNSRTNFGIQVTVEKNKRVAKLGGAYRYSPIGSHILLAEMNFSLGSDNLNIEWDKSAQHYKSKYQSTFLSDSKRILQIQETLRAIANIVPSTSGDASGKSKKKSDADVPADEKFSETIAFAKQRMGKWYGLKSSKASELRNEIASDFGSQGVEKELQNVVKDLWSQFTYIGPVRAYPERHYALVERGSMIDPRGELSLLDLMKWKTAQPKLFREVTALLHELQLADSIRPASSSEEIMRMMVKPRGHKRYVNYADTGFGVSQILPVLIKDVALGERGTVLINQPEVHLHPSAQAQLANHFVSRLNKRRFIIETHSEYMINRFRILVAEKKVNPQDVAIYFFDLDASGKSSAKRIDILPDGNLSGAPPAYFNTYSVDTMRLINAGFD